MNNVSYSWARKNDKLKMVSYQDITTQVANTRYDYSNRRQILMHNDFDEVPQRFINCLNGNSYIRPHMHIDKEQWEMMCFVSGKLILLIFDNSGTVVRKHIMSDSSVRVVEIPPFLFHTFLALEDSSYLEVRNCSYNPSIDRVYAEWSPAESALNIDKYMKLLHRADVGSKVTIDHI
jgi:cupin fold WbuC family metalloprotein